MLSGISIYKIAIKTIASLIITFVINACLISPVIANNTPGNQKILILKSNDSKLYSKIASELTFALVVYCQSCPEKRLHVDVRSIAENPDTELKSLYEEYDFLITLGKKAWIETSKLNLDRKLQKLHAVLPLDKDILDSKSNEFFLVLEQSYEKQIKILKKLFNKNHLLTAIYTEKSEWRKQLLEKHSEKQHGNIRFEKSSDIRNTLKSLIASKGSILMLPDKALYNRNNISQILLSGYSNNITFIGYSISLTKTGALASIITPQNEIANDISRLAYEIIETKKSPGIYYPQTYKVYINKNIMESLDVNIETGNIEKNKLEIVQ